MLLDDLIGVIETLKSRIQDHRPHLQANETRTRVALIDPLLTALGWDTSDPGLVTLEYDVNGKRADYALLRGHNDPIVFLEAKRLDEHLSNHRSQVVAYASELGIKYPALTNGNEWEVYDNSKLVPIDQLCVLTVSVTGDPSPKCALQLLLLWRSNMASGHPVPGNSPILEAPPIKTIDPPDPKPPASGWTPLSNFNPKSGAKPPQVIRLPNGEEEAIKSWRSLLTSVAEWLVLDGILTLEKCPVFAGRRQGFCTVHLQPRHPNGKDFISPHKLSNGLYLASHGNAKNLADKCRALMKDCGKDSSTIHLHPGSTG